MIQLYLILKKDKYPLRISLIQILHSIFHVNKVITFIK